MSTLLKCPNWLVAVLALAAIGGGTARGQSAVSETQLEIFLGLGTGSGLSSGDLTNLGNGPVTNGSAMMQTITVGPGGGILSFSYDFLTNAPSPASNPLGALDPFAFDTQPVLTDIADNFSTLIAAPSQTGFLYQTGFQTYSVSLAAGTYNWGVGVVNVTTDQYSSGLLLDDFSVTSGTIVNGSFGTGDFTGWSTIGNTSVVDFVVRNLAARPASIKRFFQRQACRSRRRSSCSFWAASAWRSSVAAISGECRDDFVDLGRGADRIRTPRPACDECRIAGRRPVDPISFTMPAPGEIPDDLATIDRENIGEISGKGCGIDLGRQRLIESERRPAE